MADPSKRSKVAALKVAFDEPAWNGWVRQYQRIFVDRKVQDDHRHVERRIAFEQLFKLGDTPQVTMQNVLKLQSSHYTEDQNIGMDRYKQNLHANRLFFIYLAKLCGIQVLKSTLGLVPPENPIVSLESSDSYFPRFDKSSSTGQLEVAAQGPPFMSPHASLSPITLAGFDFDMNDDQNQDHNQGQGYSFTPSPQGNDYPTMMSNAPPAQSQAVASAPQTQWDYQASNQNTIGAQGSGPPPYGVQGYSAQGYGSQGYVSQGQSAPGYGTQGYGTQSPGSQVAKPSQLVITTGYGYQPGYSQGHNPQENIGSSENPSSNQWQNASQFQPPDNIPASTAAAFSVPRNVSSPGVPSQQLQTTISQVPPNLKIFLFRGKYYNLTCNLCPERRFSSIQGLFIHVNQSDINHSSLIASNHSWAGALKAVATQVIDGNEQNVELHNQVFK